MICNHCTDLDDLTIPSSVMMTPPLLVMDKLRLSCVLAGPGRVWNGVLLAQSTANQLKKMDFEVILPKPIYYLSWFFVIQTFCGRATRWEKPSGSVPLWIEVSRCSSCASYWSLVTILSSDWPGLVSIGGGEWWLWLGWGITGDASYWEWLPGSLHISVWPVIGARLWVWG